MLHGGSAHAAWKRVLRRHPELGQRGLTVIETCHTNEISRASCGRLSRSSGRRVSTHPHRPFEEAYWQIVRPPVRR